MKLYSLTVFKCESNSKEEPKILASAYDLSSFNFFQRGNVKEFVVFFGRTIASRCEPGMRHQVEENEYAAYVYRQSNGLAVVLAADKEYPQRVAFTLVGKVLADFAEKYKGQYESTITKDNVITAPELEADLKKYQNPEEADKILKIQKDLDETKVILHQAIDQLLERGEKIDTLVAQSADLGTASKGFYKSAKKTNSCCVIL
eukprot:TRINITY_DN67528_c4_g8_i1.p1 TRINITY_DN67528_c4_g8~~TRINITY_DN67528_c4_g8_i1.p1  ORF type:complete len:203 (+),score=29.92 TRINITY_DN67528_c4_g8_i1:102-710(+)